MLVYKLVMVKTENNSLFVLELVEKCHEKGKIDFFFWFGSIMKMVEIKGLFGSWLELRRY